MSTKYKLLISLCHLISTLSLSSFRYYCLLLDQRESQSEGTAALACESSFLLLQSVAFFNHRCGSPKTKSQMSLNQPPHPQGSCKQNEATTKHRRSIFCCSRE